MSVDARNFRIPYILIVTGWAHVCLQTPLIPSKEYISILESRGTFFGEDMEKDRKARLEAFFHDTPMATSEDGSLEQRTLQSYLDAFKAQKTEAMSVTEKDSVKKRVQGFEWIETMLF